MLNAFLLQAALSGGGMQSQASGQRLKRAAINFAA
jgi:hypothetical protein